MHEITICKLANDIEKIVLKGVPEPDRFWIEVLSLTDEEPLEKSYVVENWEEAVKLLEKYKWSLYETISVFPAFSNHILEARNKRLNNQQRILALYRRFMQGEDIDKFKVARQYGVGDEQIVRDFAKLRTMLEGSNQTIKYDRTDNVYRLSSLGGEWLNKADVIAIFLFLYGARGMNKKEMEGVTEKLLHFLSIEEQRKIRQFFHSFHYHYEPIQTKDILQDIRNIYEAISSKRILSFDYVKNNQSKYREVIPYSLTFHNGLFYLMAKKVDSDHKEPVAWRLDRMNHLEVTIKRYKLDEPYIELGSYLNQSVNMFTGSLQKAKLKIVENILEYLHREFPIVHQSSMIEKGWIEVEVEVRGYDGILFWILQQAEFVEVLGPKELREKVSEKISRMYEIYKERQPLA